MPKFGKTSKERRMFLCNDLKKLVDEVIKEYDFSIIETHRSKDDQDRAWSYGYSNAKFGESAHNYNPSFAVDVYPYPAPKTKIDGATKLDDNSPEWENMINVFKTKAKELGIKITCGIDFKSIVDKPHIEITNWKQRVKEI